MNGNWHTLENRTEVPLNGSLSIKIGDWSVLIARTDDGLHAMVDCCTHQSAHLSGGRIRRKAIMCPLHGARFELATGKCFGGAYPDVRTFPIRESDGGIEVYLPDETPKPSEVPSMR